MEERVLLSVVAAPVVASNMLEMTPSALGSSSPGGAYSPQQIRAAYRIDSIAAASSIGDGTGQTIAIIAVYDNPRLVGSTDANFVGSDMQQFDAYFGLPDPPSFRKLDQNGGTSYPGVDPAGAGGTKSWEAEEAMDVESAHAVAPRANIVLIEASSASTADFNAAVDTARHLPGVSVVSMSGGWMEDQLTAAGEHVMDAIFTTPVGHQGVTFVASTGDSGSPGDYPAFSPNVLAVGGTSLTMSSLFNSYSYETGWGSSGGGQSTCEQEPIYQQAVQSSGFRQTPDVAFVADPNTGVAVYDSYDYGGSSPWITLGGTSLRPHAGPA